MKLGSRFYNGLASKISKICIFWSWENFFIWINYGWIISVVKVNECRIWDFLLLFIAKYFMTIHIYQIIIFSPVVYYIYLGEPVCKFYIWSSRTLQIEPTSVHNAMLKCALKTLLLRWIWILECKWRDIRN